MKVFVCNGSPQGVDLIRSLVNVSVLYRVHAQAGIDDVRLSGAELFTAQTVMTMARLVECSEKHDNIAYRSLLVAYDMPVFSYGVQQFMPNVMRSGLDDAVKDESIWNTCKGVARATYNSIVFDYVFGFYGGPSDKLLAENGVNGDVTWVENWRQIALIIGAERF